MPLNNLASLVFPREMKVWDCEIIIKGHNLHFRGQLHDLEANS